jgi:8-oxo-dGTP pyrophosphatase MutT (NUDIX family)
LSAPDHAFTIAEIGVRLSRAPAREIVHSGARAAVAAVLREGPGGAEVLLIRRAEREGDPWSGHMAFPGGRSSEQDRDLHATAVRETREEVGIDLDASGAVLGRLPDLHAVARAKRTGLVISPFVFALKHEVTLRYEAREVAEALWTPIAPLSRGERAGTIAYEREGAHIDLPCWNVEGHVVWGLTHRMLTSLFEILG